ncbi:MAG: DUF3783 domain-containing protein [Lachnospiraceae bacterium]|nr:DUF3783 domain-containing protein [Lachnospiraceae bacterium]
MRECILLFQFEQARQKKLIAQLMMAKFRVKVVSPEEMELPVGYLAGNKELLQEEARQEAEIREQVGQEAEIREQVGQAGEAGALKPLDGEMLVMAGVTSGRLNMVLQAIRKAGIGSVPYKAVVTETNQTWKAKDLLEELKKEHEAMKEMNNGGKMLHEQKIKP